MYVNLCQRYILDLLYEYDALTKNQIEFMTMQHFENHLRNIDGYLEQLHRFGKVNYINDIVVLDGREPNDDMIAAFNLVVEFGDIMVSHKKGIPPVAIEIVITATKKNKRLLNIIPVNFGFEKEITYFANKHYDNELGDSAVFMLKSEKQMQLVRPNCRYSYALCKNGDVQLFEGA